MTTKKIFKLGLLGVAGPWSWLALAAAMHYAVGEPYGALTAAAPFVVLAIFIVGLVMTDFLPAQDTWQPGDKTNPEI